MKINKSELTDLITQAAAKFTEEAAARYLAEETVEAQIRKAPRTNPLKSTVEDIAASAGKEDIIYAIDLPSYLSIDFKGQGPLVYLKQIHDELEARANLNGLAMVSFTNSQSMHTLHTWVQGLAKRGLVAVAVCNGGPRSVIPFNGTKGLFGTNPVAYGLPGKDGQIFCVDMATSEIPYFEILDAQKNKTPLGQRTAVDASGEFTTDADAALDFSMSQSDPTSNLVPLGGGYKGYYIVYLMEVLTSALIGMPASPQMSTDFVPEEHGSILMAFSPKAFGTTESFQQSVEELHSAIKAQQPKEGETIRVPGEGNNEKLVSVGDEIEISDDLIEKLKLL